MNSSQSYCVAVAGPANMRIDHCLFNGGQRVISWNWASWGTGMCIGLIDHNDFLNCNEVFFATDIWSTDGAWGQHDHGIPIVAGTTNIPVIEDNYFHMNSSFTDSVGDSAQIYGQYGGRVCARYNRFGTSTSDSFKQNWIDAHHDASPDYTGVTFYEIYGNDFHEGTRGTLGPSTASIELRGGMHLVWGNTNTTSNLVGLRLWDDNVGKPYPITNVFYWSNVLNGSSSPQSAQVQDDNTSTIQLNHQYWLAAPAAGQMFYPYTPLAYPHPLIAAQDGTASTNAPTITGQPSNQTVMTNWTATFTVTATGDGTLAYQWSLAGTNVAGATGSAWAYTPTVAQTNNVWVGVTNEYGGVMSSTVLLMATNAVTGQGGVTNGPSVASRAAWRNAAMIGM
jgi:hypothetical protein